MNKRILGFALAVWWGVAGAGAAGTEPKNLSLLKEEVVAYVESGRYDADVAGVAGEAEAWIVQRVKQGGGKLAAIFDVDETMLSNLPHMRGQDFGYQPVAWDAWVARAEGPVIAPVREVYRTARRLGVAVFYITGRREKDRVGTETNLKIVAVWDCVELVMKPDASRDTTESFKTATRKRISAAGYTIIVNIGDQESDLAGGYSERTFKLPAPFYMTK